MSSLRLLVILLLAVLLSPAGAQAQTTLATPSVPSKVATYAGVVAYSELDPATGRYRLMFDTNANGRAEPVPVAQRGVPFDVDLGPGDRGEVVAVYSRCRREPDMDRRSGGPAPVWTTARGCDLYRYDFRQAREQLLTGASTTQATEVLPSIWRDQLAFVRVYEQRPGRRGTYPYIYVRALRPSATSRRQPGGARGSAGIPGPMALDLAGSRLAFSWVYEREGGGVSELRLDTVDRSHRKLAGKGWSDSLLRYLTPHVADGRVFYGEQRSIGRAGAPGTRSISSELWRYRITTGELSRADAPAQLFAAVRDRRAFLTIFATTGDFLNTRRCGEQPCRIARGPDRPQFELVRTLRAPTRSCGDVGYTPQSDHGAFDIEARGVSCAVARGVARDAEGEPRTFTTRGFRCAGERRTDRELPTTAFTCRSGERRVWFDRS